MPVDISLHPIGNPMYGNLPPAPSVPLLEGQSGLAEGVDSNVLNVTTPAATLVLVATAKLRVDIRLNSEAASLNPGASSQVLGANERVMLSLPKGDWILRTAAYV
ncbi:hypothetical protein [Sphingorhabdus sp.]|jgi:hypothetical protein|uniref:hypothetical protein n=1 Tax=Sphingorhabdus sp. TaxID=1902408 RepID=UPI0037C8636D